MLDGAARWVGHAVRGAPCDEPTRGAWVPARTHQSEWRVDGTRGNTPRAGNVAQKPAGAWPPQSASSRMKIAAATSGSMWLALRRASTF